MNKFIKCWVFIICLLFIFLILFTDSVKAEQCSSAYNSLVYTNFVTRNANLTRGINKLYIPFPDSQYFTINNQGNIFKGQMWYVINETGNTYSTNIPITSWNMVATCTSTEVITTGGNTWGYITYQDGSSATILSTLKGAVCNAWNAGAQPTSSSVNASTTIKYQPNITTTGLAYLIDSNNNIKDCYVDSNGFYSCPYTPGQKVYGFRFLYAMSENSNPVSITYGFTSGMLNFCNDNTQQLINNQNQNAQQQHQDSQTINNSITSNDVTGNNSSSSITSIGNTFNSQEDFLLNLLTIPYTLWTSILNVFSNTCAPLDVGTMFNYHLVFPCIELNDFLGGIYATIIDVIFTAIIYSAFIRRVIKYFRELLTLDEHALITGGVKLW